MRLGESVLARQGRAVHRARRRARRDGAARATREGQARRGGAPRCSGHRCLWRADARVRSGKARADAQAANVVRENERRDEILFTRQPYSSQRGVPAISSPLQSQRRPGRHALLGGITVNGIKRWSFLAVVSGIAVLLDQATKQWATVNLQAGPV